MVNVLDWNLDFHLQISNCIYVFCRWDLNQWWAHWSDSWCLLISYLWHTWFFPRRKNPSLEASFLAHAEKGFSCLHGLLICSAYHPGLRSHHSAIIHYTAVTGFHSLPPTHKAILEKLSLDVLLPLSQSSMIKFLYNWPEDSVSLWPSQRRLPWWFILNYLLIFLALFNLIFLFYFL